MKFVQLTRGDGLPVWVNLDLVWYMYAEDELGTILVRTRTVDNNDLEGPDPEEFLIVEESPTVIMARLAKASFRVVGGTE